MFLAKISTFAKMALFGIQVLDPFFGGLHGFGNYCNLYYSHCDILVILVIFDRTGKKVAKSGQKRAKMALFGPFLIGCGEKVDQNETKYASD